MEKRGNRIKKETKIIPISLFVIITLSLFIFATLNYPSEVTAKTITGNTITGRIIDTTGTTGKYNGGYTLNAIDDELTISDNAIFDADEMTIMAWIKTTNKDNNQIIIEKFLDSDNKDWGIGIFNGRIAFESESGGNNWQGPVVGSLNNNQWHHIAVTFNRVSKTHRLYLDGVDLGGAPIPHNPPKTNANLHLGIRYYTDNQNDKQRFSGAIDELRIFNKVLTATEINNNYNSKLPIAPETILAYAFDNDASIGESVNLIKDLSGNGNDIVVGPRILWLKAEYSSPAKDELIFTWETNQPTKLSSSRLCWTEVGGFLASWCMYPKTTAYNTINEYRIKENDFSPQGWTGAAFDFSKDLIQLHLQQIQNQAGQTGNQRGIVAIPEYQLEDFEVESNKYLRLVFRHGFNLSIINNTNLFQISSADDSNYNAAKNPLKLGFRWNIIGTIPLSREQYIYQQDVYDYHVVLELPFEMQNGKTYTINTPSLPLNEHNISFANSTIQLTYTDNILSDNIHANQIGYFTNKQKYAYLGEWGGDIGPLEIHPSSFEIRNAATDTTVFTGSPYLQYDGSIINVSYLGLINNRDFANLVTGEHIYELDFTSFTTPGKYYIHVPGLGNSYNFRIGDDVYDIVLKELLRAFYHQRDGVVIEQPYSDFERQAINVNTDGYFANGTPVVDDFRSKYGTFLWINDTEHWPIYNGEIPGAFKDTSGGWHDAADSNKYVWTAPWALFDLMNAYEFFPDRFYDNQTNIPESNNGIPDILDEVKWELDWLLKMQDTDDGFVYMKVGFGENNQRNILPKTTYTTEAFTASMAQAARVFEPFDPQLSLTYLQRAELAWQALESLNTWTEENVTKNNGKVNVKNMPIEIEGVWLQSDTARTTNYAASIAGLPYGDAGTQIQDIYVSSLVPNGATVTVRYLAAINIPYGRFDEPCCGGPYEDDNPNDNRMWVAAELYKTTGKQEYYDRFNIYKGGIPGCQGGKIDQEYGRAIITFATTPDWPNINQADRDLCKFAYEYSANSTALSSDTGPYRMSSLKTSIAGWGGISDSHRYATGMIYYMIKGSPQQSQDFDFLDKALNNLNHQLGANALSTVWITGLGSKYPMNIVHSRASLYKDTLGLVPGYPLYGVTHSAAYAKKFYTETYPNKTYYPIHKSYVDIGDVAINEPAIYHMSTAVLAYTPFASVHTEKTCLEQGGICYDSKIYWFMGGRGVTSSDCNDVCYVGGTTGVADICDNNQSISTPCKCGGSITYNGNYCCNGIQNQNACDYVPPETNQTQGECQLISATWNITTATENDLVTLTVIGTAECNGKTASFIVKEYDGGWSADDLVQTNPISVTFTNGKAETTWTAEYQEDAIGDLGSPPEYYFIATVKGIQRDSGKTKTELLKVKKFSTDVKINYIGETPDSKTRIDTNSFTVNISSDKDLETAVLELVPFDYITSTGGITGGVIENKGITGGVITDGQAGDFYFYGGGVKGLMDIDTNAAGEHLIGLISNYGSRFYNIVKLAPNGDKLLGFTINDFRKTSLEANGKIVTPKVAFGSDGSLGIIWKAYDKNIANDTVDLYLTIYESDGTERTGYIKINDDTSEEYFTSEFGLAAGANGDYIVVYTKGQTGIESNDLSVTRPIDRSDVYFKIYDSTGTQKIGETKVNQYTIESQDMPDVASDSNGDFVVVWRSLWQENSIGEIMGRMYNATGSPKTNEKRVNTWTYISQRHPKIDMNPSGQFVVAWSSGYSGFNAIGMMAGGGTARDRHEWGIAAQVFNSNGQMIGDEIKVNNKRVDSQQFPSVSIDNAGRFVVTWESAWQDPLWIDKNQLHIQSNYRLYDQFGNPLTSELAVSKNFSWSNFAPITSIDSNGNFIIIFEASGGETRGKLYDSSEFTKYTKPVQAKIYPTMIEGNKGDIVSYDLVLQNVENLHEVEFNLRYNNPGTKYFDSGILKAIDVREGSFLKSRGATTFTPPNYTRDTYIGGFRESETNGIITLQNSATTVSGSGTLATIDFEVIKDVPQAGLKTNEKGYARIFINNIILRDVSGNVIPFETIEYNSSTFIYNVNEMYSDGSFRITQNGHISCVENVSIQNETTKYEACSCGGYTLYGGTWCCNGQPTNYNNAIGNFACEYTNLNTCQNNVSLSTPCSCGSAIASSGYCCNDTIKQNSCDQPQENCDQDNDGDNKISCGGNDCNDNNPLINPAATEICGNSIDEDCSGQDLACSNITAPLINSPTNITMNGSGKYWGVKVENIAFGEWTYKVYGNTSQGNKGASEPRFIFIGRDPISFKTTNYGCSTTDFNALEHYLSINLVLENCDKGRIRFIEPLKLLRNIDFDTHSYIKNREIFIDSSQVPELNKAAILYFYNVSLTNPIVLKDGINCISTGECQILNYNTSSKILEVQVSNFSLYSVTEGETIVESSSPVNNPGGGGSNSGTSIQTITTADCIEDWECRNWGICINSKRVRTCKDNNNCKSQFQRPITEEACTISLKINYQGDLETPREDTLSFEKRMYIFIGIVIAIIFLSAALLIVMIRNKNRNFKGLFIEAYKKT